MATVLTQRLRPALRLEQPVAPSMLVGRDELAAQALADLRHGYTVALTGPAGIGKTALGAHLAAHWGQLVFWYTLRPGLNDFLSSLLFALGYFLQRQGAANLWLQLIADQGALRLETTLGLLRHDLTCLSAEVLLVVDELDLLRPAEVQAHGQLLAFLESLRGLVPLLLLGQQLLMEVNKHYTLPGLSSEDSRKLLASGELQLTPGELENLQVYTQGNPCLLHLVLALHHAEQPWTETLAALSDNPSMEFLFHRVWRRLDAEEQTLLAALSVFRRPAPADIWSQATLARLVNRGLVLTDVRGGVELLVAFQRIVLALLTPEQQEVFHQQAAEIYATRGDYTAAAYHYLQARQYSTAIHLWYQYRTQEIAQGQAETARALFREVDRLQVHGSTQEILALICAELDKLMGNYDRAWQELRATTWQTPLLKARARRLEGDIAEVLSNFARARRAYQEGLEVLESELARFHKNLGWVAMREQNLEDAWREALLARYEAANLQGQIQSKWGHYAQAAEFYQEALLLAQTAAYAQGAAKTHKNFAVLLARQGRFAEAEEHWQAASRHFERIGDVTNLASLKVNQALALNLAKQYQSAILPARESLMLFERLGQTYGLAVAAQNGSPQICGRGWGKFPCLTMTCKRKFSNTW